MNFLGHAAVARWVDADPRWVLGAMIPDFASMSRARVSGADCPTVAAGIAYHHATDDAFHGAPTFLDLYVRGTATLEAAGVERGPARAVAHVGTELVLDGLLLDDDALASAYLLAVHELPRVALQFRGDGEPRFARLRDRLLGHGLPHDYRDPERVALRLEQILAHRPRLALASEHRAQVTAFLEQARDELADRLPTLWTELRAQLPAVPSEASQSDRIVGQTVR
jgi:acyl carrier protein phosphodiesterase